jgi:hypothetical protein
MLQTILFIIVPLRGSKTVIESDPLLTTTALYCALAVKQNSIEAKRLKNLCNGNIIRFHKISYIN